MLFVIMNFCELKNAVNNALFKNVTLLWFVCCVIKVIRLSIILRAHIIFTLALLHNTSGIAFH